MRMGWNLTVMVLLLYTASIVPYRVTFIDGEDDTDSFFFYFDLLVDILYITDFCLQFFMAYEDLDKKIETRLSKIAVNYLRGWFTLDLVSCIPF